MQEEKKYGVIYADPPWQYQVYFDKGKKRSAENHYSMMTIKKIEQSPIDRIADKDCLLFLWDTFPTMLDAFKVIKASGYNYKKVAFVWIKKKSDSLFWGLGFWTRANAEICLLASKGHPKRFSKRVHQGVVSRIERHSKKPDEVRKRIEELTGDVEKIELFARQATDGWDVWRNEVECDITLDEERMCENGFR